MTDSIETKKSARVIFWVVGIFALVWNVILSMNLFEQMSPAGVAALPEDYQIFFTNRPQWAFAGFAVSVVAGLLAAVALLLRRKQAIWAFIVSFIGGACGSYPDDFYRPDNDCYRYCDDSCAYRSFRLLHFANFTLIQIRN